MNKRNSTSKNKKGKKTNQLEKQEKSYLFLLQKVLKKKMLKL